MKVFEGKPDGHVLVTPDPKSRKKPYLLEGGPFTWGVAGPQSVALALAILSDVFGKGMRATKLHGRFNWRAVKTMPKGGPWALNEDAIMAVVQDIEKVESSDHAQALQRQKDTIPVANEGGREMGGRVEWDATPELKPNPPLEKKG